MTFASKVVRWIDFKSHRCNAFVLTLLFPIHTQVSIYSLYAADVAAGLASSFLVSPSITILDRAISMNASGAMKTADSIRYGH